MPRRTDRLWISFGQQVRDARLARRWSVRELAQRAGTSAAMLYRVEAGEPASTDLALRLATALGRRAELQLIDPRRRHDRPPPTNDLVHSEMGELEAAHLRRHAYTLGIDEPYQHYQFAGRADVVAWDIDRRALLHIENRTRFPDFQEMAGAYNAKRAYLGAALAQRAGIASWRSETHVIAALWSAEVLHSLRLRRASFESLCPDPPHAFEAWWAGMPPPAGRTSSLIVLDPLARGRQRVFIGLDEALERARPRHRGYANVAASLDAQ
jgi:transcriptional regulator with XRE-family HTH domain